MIFELAQDFHDTVAAMPKDQSKHWMLGLLEEAMRRDIHFIVRHPTTLFQCMWNTCWWYDCPEAAKHYERPGDGSDAGLAPWERDGPKLSRLLQSWRSAKKLLGSQFRWVRAMRPPAVPLGAGQIAVLNGQFQSGRIMCVAFSPDGTSLASTGTDGTLRLWNVELGTERWCFESLDRKAMREPGALYSACFSSDGKRIVCGGYLDHLCVVDAANGTELFRIDLESTTGDVALSPDNRLLAAATADGLWICETAAGSKGRFLAGHSSWLRRIAFVQDGRRIVGGHFDGTVSVWNLAGGDTLLCRGAHKGEVRSVCCSPDGRHMASAATDGSLTFWDAETGKAWRWLEGVTVINSIRYSPDGRRIVVSCGESLELLDAETGECLGTLAGHAADVRAAVFSPDGKLIASSSDDGTVRLWQSSAASKRWTVRGDYQLWTSMDFSPEGRRIATGGNGQVCVWNADTGQPEQECEADVAFSDVVFSADGRRVTALNISKCVASWEVQSTDDTGAAAASNDSGLAEPALEGSSVSARLLVGEVAFVENWQALAWFRPVLIYGQFRPGTDRTVYAGLEKNLCICKLEEVAPDTDIRPEIDPDKNRHPHVIPLEKATE